MGNAFKIGNNYVIKKSTKLDKKDVRDGEETLIESFKLYAERLNQFEIAIINPMNWKLSNKVRVLIDTVLMLM